MTTTAPSAALPAREARFFRVCFLVAALWNLVGAVPGVLDPAGMFAREFGRALVDPVQVAIYRGAWGTALLYGFGFLLVARDPVRHSGVVAMGGLGKALFALNLAFMYLSGWTSWFAIVVIVGDIVFVAVFAGYFICLRRSGIAPL